MVCQNCGNTLEEGAVVCTDCGYTQDVSHTETQIGYQYGTQPPQNSQQYTPVTQAPQNYQQHPPLSNPVPQSYQQYPPVNQAPQGYQQYPPVNQTPQGYQQYPAMPPAVKKKPIYKRVWFWIIISVVIIIIIAPNSTNNDNPNSTTSSSPPSSSSSSSQETGDSPSKSTQDKSEEQIPVYGEDDYKRDSKEIAYDELVRNPDLYKGERISVTVKILQIMDGGFLKEAGYRANSGKNEWFASFNLPDGAPRILVNDYVTFWGEYEGVTEVTRALTKTKDYIPKIKVSYYEIAEKKDISFNDSFIYDDLEIVFSSEIEWDKVQNRYSEHSGADVIKIPIKIINIGEETNGLSSFSYNVFDPDGLKTESVSYYFDDDIGSLGDMRPGAEQNAFFHILYKGDGDYFIEFGLLSKEIEVKLNIKKPE